MGSGQESHFVNFAVLEFVALSESQVVLWGSYDYELLKGSELCIPWNKSGLFCKPRRKPFNAPTLLCFSETHEVFSGGSVGDGAGVCSLGYRFNCFS